MTTEAEQPAPDLSAIHEAQHAGPAETCLRCQALRDGRAQPRQARAEERPAASPELSPSSGLAAWDIALADIAEHVAHLRKEIAGLPAALQAAYERGAAEGQELARASIVKMLRRRDLALAALVETRADEHDLPIEHWHVTLNNGLRVACEIHHDVPDGMAIVLTDPDGAERVRYVRETTAVADGGTDG
jgi:hypothetical protein